MLFNCTFSNDLFPTNHVVAMALVVLTALAYLWRSLPEIFLIAPEGTDIPFNPDPTFLGHYHEWMIRTRWIICLILALLGPGIAGAFGILDPAARIPLSWIVFLLALTNLAYREAGKNPRLHELSLQIQIYLDLFFLMAVVHLTGGSDQPMAYLAVLHIILAGVLLSPRDSFGVAGVAWVIYSSVAIGEAHMGHHHHHTLHLSAALQRPPASQIGGEILLNIVFLGVILFLTATVAATIIGRLRFHEHRSRILAEEALGERRRLEQMVEEIGAGLIILDHKLQPLWMNPTLMAWFSREGDDSDGVDRRLMEWLGCEKGAAARCLEDGRSRVGQEKAPDNQDLTLQYSICRSNPTDESPAQVMALVQDVSRQSLMQAQLLRSARLATVGEIAARVAHDATNPAFIISSKARLLLKNYQSQMCEKVAKDLEKIGKQADRLGRLTGKLLDDGAPRHLSGDPTRPSRAHQQHPGPTRRPFHSSRRDHRASPLPGTLGGHDGSRCRRTGLAQPLYQCPGQHARGRHPAGRDEL